MEQIFTPVGKEAIELFANPPQQGIRSLKFIVIQPPRGNIQLLIHEKNDIRLHASAVLLYMQEHNLIEIKINGGAHLTLHLHNKKAVVSHISTAFGGACRDEIQTLLVKLLPDWEIVFEKPWPFKGPDGSMEFDGTQYSLEQITHEANQG